MKTLFCCVLATLVFGGAVGALGEPAITDDLETRLERASPNELIAINMAMQEQIDRSHLESLLAGKKRRERREIMVRELKAFAARNQAAVLGYLRDMESRGEVAAIRSLWVNNVICCKATRDVVRTLAKLPGITSIDWDEERHVIMGRDPVLKVGNKAMAWGVLKIRAPEVWALGNTGQGVLVSVHDTGVYYSHPDLQDHMWDGGAPYPNHGWDFYNNDNDPMDGHGHGTHCAGTIAGDGTAGCSTGVAPDATVMALKVASDQGSARESDVWESIQFAIDQGVDVMSFSIGWMHAWNPARATWRNTFGNAMSAGLIAAAAAGNEREWGFLAPDNVRTPGDVPPPWLHPDQTLTGCISGVVTCGATDSADSCAEFSSYGPVSWEGILPWLDYPYRPEMGLIDPDVAAPGVDVLSCLIGGGYTEMSGTSMATPHIAGAMCLVLSGHPDWLPASVDKALEMTAVDLALPGKDNDYGSGRIDAYEAVAYGGPTSPDIYLLHCVIDDPPPGNQNGRLDPGETADFIVTVINVGLGAANVDGMLRESDPWVSLSDSASNFGAIAPGDSVNNSPDPYVLTADPSAPVGHLAACTLYLTADGGYEVDRPVTLVVGDPTAGPSGPDNYGYYCYDDRDVSYAECPTYDWLEIGPPGPGTIIDEISHLPGAWTTRTLPFTFKYYGEDQSLISISTSGWMSFGLAYDYYPLSYPIPHPWGPAAMVAPFWDDFDLDSILPWGHGDVYEYYDEANHRYILEWKEVAHMGMVPSPWETFQVILYDPLYNTTLTGDGEILCQYERVEWLVSCATGMENYDEDDGIQYFFRGSYDFHASLLEVGRAIKFTTDPPLPVGVEEFVNDQLPMSKSQLVRNFPNPFGQFTIINYQIPKGGHRTQGARHITLSVYDLSGRMVTKLVDEKQSPGHHTAVWDGTDQSGLPVASGIYFCKLTCGDSAGAKKMVVLR